MVRACPLLTWILLFKAAEGGCKALARTSLLALVTGTRNSLEFLLSCFCCFPFCVVSPLTSLLCCDTQCWPLAGSFGLAGRWAAVRGAREAAGEAGQNRRSTVGV